MTLPTLASTDPVLHDFAAAVGAAGPVTVEGGRTHWDRGGGLSKDAHIVTAPSGIVDIQPAEMTVTVRAGATITELHDALDGVGQRSALPANAAPGATVGGAIAVGDNDYRMATRGRLRDSVLQLRYVSADGRLITAGGPTVKNVTGFDLPRIHVGALGTLGLLAEVILRTNPIPPAQRWLRCSDADPVELRRHLYRPSAVLWDGTTTWVHLEGHEIDIDQQHQLVVDHVATDIVPEPPELPEHRWSLTPAELGTFDHSTARHAEAFIAVVGCGLAFCSTKQPTRSVTRSVAEISERLKDQFDPTGRLNPGRTPTMH